MPRTRVLLVDDSWTLRTSFARAFEAAGFETVAVGDAAEALDVLALRRFDIVLADYQLPETTGLELLARLRRADGHLALILYSGLVTDDVAAEARELRVTSVLEKPVSIERLVGEVRAALG